MNQQLQTAEETAPRAPGSAVAGAESGAVERAVHGDEVDTILAELAKERRSRRKRQKRLALCAAFYFLFVVSMITLVAAVSKHPSSGFGMLGMFGAVGGFAAGWMAVADRHKALTRRVAELDDVRAVGPLIDALAFVDEPIRALAERRLTALLPQAHASDAEMFDSERRTILYGRLATFDKAKEGLPFFLSLLKALEQVGDEKAIPGVQRIAEAGHAAHELREAAAQCLPFLEARAASAREGGLLLRAASAAGSAAEQSSLLRAASGTQHTSAQELLRADGAEQA